MAADRVFDGTRWHEHSAIVVEDSQVQQVVSRAETPAVPLTNLPDGVWLAPGFIDIQVNGGGDVLFNDCPTAKTISVIAAAHRKFGTTGFLPTLITDAPEKTSAAIAAVREAVREQPAVLGLHLEGPFISRDKPGVHDPAFIRVPTSADLDVLTAPRSGALVVTLAPEQVPAQFIARLVASGACVCLGHSMATYAQTRAAIAEGLSGFTHLFNAMRQLESREPGPIAAALESASCSYGLIVDGVHVDPAMLRLALRGLGNPLLVTDAMPPVGGARSTFLLYNEEIRIEQGRCIRGDGTLAGAFLDMASAVRNCVRLLGLPLDEALRLATVNPAAFLGIKAGRLAPGFRADMIAFEPRDIEVLRTWIAGTEPDASD
ncbi:MAG TPA: N-acetylglucosamine-6-phosphate deacetylase [Xanthobacteraceae bacterium]|nr:N-acetylglucosamine-6-phosphate deacetylase [Xanthobacteraceae bacterium]